MVTRRVDKVVEPRLACTVTVLFFALQTVLLVRVELSADDGTPTVPVIANLRFERRRPRIVKVGFLRGDGGDAPSVVVLLGGAVVDPGVPDCAGGVPALVPPVEPVDPLDPPDPPDPPDPVEPVEPVEPVDPVEPVAPVEPEDPLVPVDPVDPVEPEDPVGHVGPLDPLAPVEPVDPVAPVDPGRPGTSGRPGRPVGPVGPVEPVQSEVPAARAPLVAAVEKAAGTSAAAAPTPRSPAAPKVRSRCLKLAMSNTLLVVFRPGSSPSGGRQLRPPGPPRGCCLPRSARRPLLTALPSRRRSAPHQRHDPQTPPPTFA